MADVALTFDFDAISSWIGSSRQTRFCALAEIASAWKREQGRVWAAG
jgi:hypothetical protein